MRILILLFITFSTYSQKSIQGIVKNNDGNYIGGANILIPSQNQILFSDDRGMFYLNTDLDSIIIRISHVGYISNEFNVGVKDKKMIEFVLDDGIILNDEVKVTSTRVKRNSPYAYSNVTKNFIEKNNIGSDIPFIIQSTPSTYATSDAGNGVGYTSLRIRGSDATRINVTINGIPYNDSESHGVFWVNLPDLASSSSSIQVQRGVGSSTNGGGAFGGTVSIKTGNITEDFRVNYSSSAGSFKTFKNSLEVNSGLIKEKVNFNLRLSKINSDGYIDRSSSDLKSYYASASYYGKKTVIDLINFSGKEKTYQSWWGTPQSRIENDLDGMNAVIANNGYNNKQSENLLNSGRTFNYYLYENETDNYQQDHYQVHFNHEVSKSSNLHLALHYTYGRGYYEQFREDDNLFNYYNILENKEIDLVRRRWLDNHFYGITYSFFKKMDNGELNIGGAINEYDGDHFGLIIDPVIEIKEPYYFSKSFKTDYNIFFKYNFNISKSTELFSDLQIRGYTHKMKGNDNDKSEIDKDKSNIFLNPKIGLTSSLNEKVNLYGSVAVANREPIRSDYIDSNIDPKHETLYDFEFGKNYSYKKGFLNSNIYLMEYVNQLITTGEVNDVGAYVRTNVKKSRRFGLELSNTLNTNRLMINTSLSLSKNLVYNFKEYIYDYGSDFSEYNTIINNFDITNIAFSPSVIGNNFIEWRLNKNFNLAWKTKYVSSQYLDNTSNKNRAINSFFINDLEINASFINNLFNNLFLKISINNIFNRMYSSNGYTFGYYGGLDYEVRENYYYPQAGRNFMFTFNLKI